MFRDQCIHREVLTNEPRFTFSYIGLRHQSLKQNVQITLKYFSLIRKRALACSFIVLSLQSSLTQSSFGNFTETTQIPWKKFQIKSSDEVKWATKITQKIPYTYNLSSPKCQFTLFYSYLINYSFSNTDNLTTNRLTRCITVRACLQISGYEALRNCTDAPVCTTGFCLCSQHVLVSPQFGMKLMSSSHCTHDKYHLFRPPLLIRYYFTSYINHSSCHGLSRRVSVISSHYHLTIYSKRCTVYLSRPSRSQPHAQWTWSSPLR
jgi:hypothetical protein